MLGLFVLALAGCGSSGTKDDGTLTLILEGPDGSDPLTGASSLQLQVFAGDPQSGDQKPLASQSFSLPGSIVLDHTPTGSNLWFQVTIQGGSGNLTGLAGPQNVIDGQHLVLTIIMQDSA